MVADGLEGPDAALAAKADAVQAMRNATTHLIVTEGTFGFAASDGTIGDAQNAFIDLFQTEDVKIVRHWDTRPKIPAEMAPKKR